MIVCSTVTKSAIRSHYDLATPFYRLLWGRHIHHGLWDGEMSPVDAQERLIATMMDRAGIQAGNSVLDVGCGMGGSSIHLARAGGCTVTGVTISRLQRTWAGVTAWRRGVASRTRFLCQDAERVNFPPQSFDVVWSIECTEHLFEKAEFFRRAAGWLKPGGRMAICAWLAGSDETVADRERQVYEVCEGFLCPSLGRAEDYCTWMQDAGLVRRSYDDWTERVAQTWEICLERIQRSGVRKFARPTGRNMVRFLDRFGTILEAYRSGAMRYGCFVFEKPEARST